MIRKIIVLSFFFINFATLASAAQDPGEILFQTITDSEAKELNIEIPASTPPGFKSLEVSVSGSLQEATFKTILFCKSIDGIIHWDNNCPDLTGIATQSSLDSADSRDHLPNYNPLSQPKKTTDTAVIAFAALTAVTGAGAVASRILTTNSAPTTNQQGYMAQLSRGGAIAASTLVGRGDERGSWSKARSQRLDQAMVKTGKKISGASPLATRILSDGNYLRSFFGPISLIIYPIAMLVGAWAAQTHHREAMPPTLSFVLALMTIGVIDSLAGFIASLIFGISILAAGSINSLSSGLTVAGIGLLVFSPALLAGAFRPLRRSVWNFPSLWERGTDYLLASVLTGWVVTQIVGGLPGLAGLQLPTTVHANLIGYVASILVLLRFAAEDLALTLFPRRLSELEPKYQSRTISQQLFSTLFKVVVFGTIAGKFIGISAELFIGIFLFTLPLIMEIFESKFPKSQSLRRWMPTGIIELLTMTIVGFFLAGLVQNRYPDARTYVLVSFILLSLPSFLIKILTLFGADGADQWKVSKYGSLFYRVFGVVALAALIYIIFSGVFTAKSS